MLIVYVDADPAARQRLSDTFQTTHRLMLFPELFEAYKWIKHNEIPDLIVTEMDVDASTGLQSLRFLQSKAKLKQTHLVGYTQQAGDYTDFVIAEGAAALFPKDTLVDDLSAYMDGLSNKKARTLRDVVAARGKKATAKQPERKRAEHR